MFCEKCGTQNLEDAKFCEKCGNKFGGSRERTIEDNKILLQVMPTFKFFYQIGIVAIIITLIVLITTIGISINISGNTFTAMFVVLLIMGTIFGIATWFGKKQFENTRYDFYKTKVVYHDSFLNLSEKEVKYKYIREITVSQGIFQRIFNIGTITLYTNAESGTGNGIVLSSIENVQEYYKEIKQLINT